MSNPPTLPDLVDALSEVLLTEFPSKRAARLAAALVSECRDPEPEGPVWESVIAAAKATQPDGRKKPRTVFGSKGVTT